MRSLRRRKLIHFLVVALLVWLGVDSLSRGACAHDLVAFSRTHAEMGGGSSSQPAPADQDGVNHCSCHWHYLAAASPQCLASEAAQPIDGAARRSVPDVMRRLLDRPPQPIA